MLYFGNFEWLKCLFRINWFIYLNFTFCHLILSFLWNWINSWWTSNINRRIFIFNNLHFLIPVLIRFLEFHWWLLFLFKFFANSTFTLFYLTLSFVTFDAELGLIKNFGQWWLWASINISHSNRFIFSTHTSACRFFSFFRFHYFFDNVL